MSQNIYDREDFFSAYMKFIDRSGRDITEDPAWKRLHRLLPSTITDFNILDLGCGSGWFSRWAIDNGAKSISALDISQNMISKAKTLNEANQDYSSKINYRIADLDIVPLDMIGPFDLVFSSLTLHYLANLRQVVNQVYAELKPGGSFVFNVEHPIYTAPRNPGVVENKETGEKNWGLNSYPDEGERVIDWLAPGLRKQHRTLTGYMEILLGAGFQITGFIEFLPTKEERESGEIDEIEYLRPLFLMMSVKKPQ